MPSVVDPMLLPCPPDGRRGWPWDTPVAPRAAHANLPRISIITPSFNQAAFLEQTIRSVLLQQYPNLQYIVIDGGSSDGSVEILQKYAPWLDYWISEPDRGQSHAIRKGLSRCDGEWVNWLNSDDYLLPGALHAVGCAAVANPAARLIAGLLDVITSDGALERTYDIKVTGCVADDIVNHRMAQPAMFYRRVPGFVPEESLHYAMDYGLWVKLLADHGIAGIRKIPERLAAFRLHPTSKTSTAAPRFEVEERRVLHALLHELGAPRTILTALAPDQPGGSPTVSRCTHVRRTALQRAVAHRYLLGDLRRSIAAQGIAASRSLLWACLLSAPTATVSTSVRQVAKRMVAHQR